jgi:guanine deaminase
MSNPFMARAIALALDNVRSGRGGPFGALIVRNREILAEGANSVTATNDPTAHAEMVAIRAACQRLAHFELTGCEIYTTCEPCPMCLGAIYWARPARVYFACTASDAATSGFDDSFIYQEIVRPQSARKIPMSSIMRAEALEIFRTWDAQASKVRY